MTEIQREIRRAITMTRGGENPAEILPLLLAIERRIDLLVRLQEELNEGVEQLAESMKRYLY